MVHRPAKTPIAALAGAEFISLAGNQIALVVIPVLVLQLTNSPLTAGIAGIGNILPVILSAVIGGPLIDRFNAYRVSIVSDILSGLSVAALPLVLLHDPDVSPAIIFFLVFMGAVFDPTGMSARQTLVPRMAEVSGVSLNRVNSYRGTLENSADLLGPVLGTWLLVYIGITGTFALNAISFFAAAAIMFFLVPYRGGTGNAAVSVAGLRGLRYVLHNAQLRALAITGMAANLVLLPFLGLLLPVLAVMHLKSPVLLGFCLSAFGLAATIGAFGFNRLSRSFSRSAIYYGGLIITSISIVLCSVVQPVPAIVLCVAFSGLLLGAGNPLVQTVLHEVTPRDIAGQVFTYHNALSFLAGPVGLLAAGMLVERTDVLFVMRVSGGFLFVIAVAGSLLLPVSDHKQT